jgi:hypothetical protein
MGHNYGNPTNRVRAAELLRKIRPEAAKKYAGLKSDGLSMEATSSVGEASLKWYTADKCVGIHVYQGDKGGWFADFAFADLPAGIPVVIGTPSLYPHGSRKEAIDQATAFLAMLMNKNPPNENPEDVEVVFSFDDMNVMLPSTLIATMKAIDAPHPPIEYVVQRLEDIRHQFAGGKPFTAEIMTSLSEEDRMVVVRVCAMALVFGMPRYPLNAEGEPPPKRSKFN